MPGVHSLTEAGLKFIALKRRIKSVTKRPMAITLRRMEIARRRSNRWGSSLAVVSSMLKIADPDLKDTLALWRKQWEQWKQEEAYAEQTASHQLGKD